MNYYELNVHNSSAILWHSLSLSSLYLLMEEVLTFNIVRCINIMPWSGLPQWLSGKESACNAGATGNSSSIPGSGKFPREGNGNPLQYSCLENFDDRKAQRAIVHRVAKSRTRLKQLSTTLTLMKNYSKIKCLYCILWENCTFSHIFPKWQ